MLYSEQMERNMLEREEVEEKKIIKERFERKLCYRMKCFIESLLEKNRTRIML